MRCPFVYSLDHSSFAAPSVHPSVSASHIHPTHILAESSHNSLSDKRVTTRSTCGFYLLTSFSISCTYTHTSLLIHDPYSQRPFESSPTSPLDSDPAWNLAVLQPSGTFWSYTPLLKESCHSDSISAFIKPRRCFIDPVRIYFMSWLRGDVRERSRLHSSRRGDLALQKRATSYPLS